MKVSMESILLEIRENPIRWENKIWMLAELCCSRPFLWVTIHSISLVEVN